MPWIPIDRLPEEAKDGREVIAWDDGVMRFVTFLGRGKWRDIDNCETIRPTHFYLFENGKTMPDAPEVER